MKDLSVPLDHTVCGIGFDLYNQSWPGKDVILWEGGLSLEVWHGGREPINVRDYEEYKRCHQDGFLCSIPNTGTKTTPQFLYPKELQRIKQSNYIGLLKNGCDISCCRVFFLVGQNVCFQNIYSNCDPDTEDVKSPNCVSCVMACCDQEMEVKYKIQVNADDTFTFLRIETPLCGCPEPEMKSCDPCTTPQPFKKGPSEKKHKIIRDD